jgi:predicted nuclease of predicted toxin-antitoxin system
MKVLIDECAPKELKTFFAKHGHESRTVQEAGWSGKQNGELLKLAETDFDVLVTVDTNLRYQQNLEGRRIGVVVLQSSSNRLDHLRQYFPACLLAIEKIKPVKSCKWAVLCETSDGGWSTFTGGWATC